MNEPNLDPQLEQLIEEVVEARRRGQYVYINLPTKKGKRTFQKEVSRRLNSYDGGDK